MSQSLVNQRAKQAILKQIDQVFKLNRCQVLPQLSPVSIEQTALVTQSHGTLVDYLPLLKPVVKEFEPAGNWAYLATVKFKLKWREVPEQITVGKRIFSVFRNANCYINQSGDQLVVLPTITDQVYICLSNSPNWTNLTTSCTLAKIPVVLVEHRDLDRLDRFRLDQPLVVAGRELNLCAGYQHVRVTLNRHGLYLNSSNRNRTQPTELEIDAESSQVWVADACWKLMVVELTSPISNNLIFSM